jgi:hypothetical protein
METTLEKSDYTQSASAATVAGRITCELDSTTISTADALDESSSIISFYFKIAVIILSFIGTAANGIALFALVSAKQVKLFSKITQKSPVGRLHYAFVFC